MKDIQKVCVIGAGVMGQQIALNAAVSGFTVVLTDSFPKALEKAGDWSRAYLNTSVQKGKMKQEEMDAALGRLTLEGDLEKALPDTDLVIEFRDGKLSVGGYELPCSNSLRVFMDKTVFELFADEREALSLVVPVCTGGCRIEVGGVFEQSLLWEYDTRDVFRYYDD